MQDKNQYLKYQLDKAYTQIKEAFKTKGTKEDKQEFINDFQQDDEIIFQRFDWMLKGFYGSEYINHICHRLKNGVSEKDVAIEMFNLVVCLEWNISINQLRDCYKKLNVNFKELNKKVVEAFQSFYENFNVESIY